MSRRPLKSTIEALLKIKELNCNEYGHSRHDTKKLTA